MVQFFEKRKRGLRSKIIVFTSRLSSSQAPCSTWRKSTRAVLMSRRKCSRWRNKQRVRALSDLYWAGPRGPGRDAPLASLGATLPRNQTATTDTDGAKLNPLLS